MSICFDIIPERGFWGLINSPMFWELKLNDFLKTDGQNCCALLLGLRNDYQFHQILPPGEQFGQFRTGFARSIRTRPPVLP